MNDVPPIDPKTGKYDIPRCPICYKIMSCNTMTCPDWNCDVCPLDDQTREEQASGKYCTQHSYTTLTSLITQQMGELQRLNDKLDQMTELLIHTHRENKLLRKKWANEQS